MNIDKKTFRQMQWLIVFTLLLLVGLWHFNVVLGFLGFLLHVLFPFLLGGAIAFVLSVPMTRLQKRIFKKAKPGGKLDKLSAPLSLLLTLALVIAVISLVSAVVLPDLAQTVASLGRTLPIKVPALVNDLEKLFEQYPDIIQWLESNQLNWDEVLGQVVDFFKVGANAMLGSTITAAKGIVSGVTTFFIAFVFACYILLQKKQLTRQSKKLIYAYIKKDWADEVLRICALTHRTFANFLTGQCLEAVILGCMFFAAMTVFRFPYALLVSVLIAFTALIPIFGAFIGCVVGAFLILTINPSQALGFVILFLVVQQLEGNFVYPHVVGNSVGLPSIWVLAAVTLGGSLFGVVGMLVFIPTVSVLYTILRGHVHYRLEKKGLKIE